MSRKKKSIAALGAAIAEREKNSTDQTSAVQQLVEAYLSTNNEAKRAKKIAEIKSRCGGLNELLSQNSELLTAEVEQALLRAATGYTVTDRTIRCVNGVKTVETKERHIPPSQPAIEFYLINKKGGDYSRNGGGSGNADGALAASAASGSKTAGSSAAAFDDAYDLGEDDDRRAQRPPLHSVAEIVERLQSLPQFKGIRFATLTGRDDDTTKSQVMADFESGITPILVATTVIEVGVDVPNANIIVIENAERYGLSALHQLRGRVGRGAAESWCFLVSDNASESVQKRLRFLCSTSDGFAVAQYDLETRGPGDFFGSRQHGLPTLQIADLMNDTRTLHAAQSEAVALLAEDPLLERPEHALLARQVEQMFDQAGAMN